MEFGSTSDTPNNADNKVYRFFNNDTGIHFYTADETERDAVLELDNFSFERGSYQAIDDSYLFFCLKAIKNKFN
ncbi:MAG: hypothetical protein ACFCAD_15495 [Pleurocapsa sp.]